MKTNFKHIQLYTIIFVLLSIITSCDNTFKSEYNRLKNSKIIFPNNMKMTFEGKDTIINDMCNSDFKLIVYKDSLSCTPCYIESLPQWFTIINKYNSKKLNVFFILCPTLENETDLRLLMEINRFKYPVLIDEKKYFQNINPQISSNKLLHTFLLDKNDKVILIGDPLNDKKIKDLFEQEIK